MPEKSSTLDVLADANDAAFQKREFIFERVGWLGMAVIIAAACLGVFGNGVLSHAELKEDSFRLRYDRFLHLGALTTLSIELAPQGDADSGIASVALPNSYLQNFRIEEIIPEPESVAYGDQTLFWFTIAKLREPTLIQFRIEPEQFGSLNGKISVNHGQAYEFQQFVYP